MVGASALTGYTLLLTARPDRQQTPPVCITDPCGKRGWGKGGGRGDGGRRRGGREEGWREEGRRGGREEGREEGGREEYIVLSPAASIFLCEAYLCWK